MPEDRRGSSARSPRCPARCSPACCRPGCWCRSAARRGGAQRPHSCGSRASTPWVRRRHAQQHGRAGAVELAEHARIPPGGDRIPDEHQPPGRELQARQLGVQVATARCQNCRSVMPATASAGIGVRRGRRGSRPRPRPGAAPDSRAAARQAGCAPASAARRRDRVVRHEGGQLAADRIIHTLYSPPSSNLPRSSGAALCAAAGRRRRWPPPG